MNVSLASALAVLTSLSIAGAESRHALVIGNNAYQNARALVNPKNDAIAIAAKLRAVGFGVTERTDATNKGMKDALREFSGKVPEGSVCLIYYAGHGVQIKGQNYLVPVDAHMAAEYEVPDETLPMDTVVRALGETKSKLNIFVLDCCRDDPFARSWKGSRSVGGSGGLVMPADMPQGMFVAFSTSPNKTADDGEGKNSPYATALLEELGQQGLDFEMVFKNVGAKVVKATGGKQEPWSNSKFYGRFSFVVSADGALPTTPASGPSTTSDAISASPPESPPMTPAEPSVELPSRGYFSVAQVYEGTSYGNFNDYSKRRILQNTQKKLAALELYKGEIDGNMGPGTQRAILEWQSQQGFKKTGKLDGKTQSGLGVAGIKETQEPSPPVQTRDAPDRQIKPKPAIKSAEYPVANKIPGEAGFCFSPYNNRVIDVRGIPSGTLVQDPTSSGKRYFRAP